MFARGYTAHCFFCDMVEVCILQELETFRAYLTEGQSVPTRHTMRGGEARPKLSYARLNLG